MKSLAINRRLVR